VTAPGMIDRPAVVRVLSLTAVLTWLIAAPAALARTTVIETDPGRAALGEAVAAAAPGDTIVVSPGVYRERGIVVTEPLTIAGRQWPVVDGENGGEILTIRSDGVTVRGLEFRNVGTSFMEDRAAVKIIDAAGCRVESNRVRNGFFGIYLENSEKCTIAGNSISGGAVREATSGNGIHAWHCRDITVKNNTVIRHRDGIYFEFVENSSVEDNRSNENLRYGLHFMFSHHTRYTRNSLGANGAGVAVMYSRDITMTGNRFEHSRGGAAYGLLLKEIKESRIAGNVFEQNTIGLYSEGSDRVTVTRNRFSGNGYGVKVMANSTENVFSFNNFVGNAFDVATNSRQNFNTFESNYWSRYSGYDLDGDGVGDVDFHPVRLFALLVEREPAGIVLMHSLFVRIIDAAERVLPVFTPETLVDEKPLMEMIEFDRAGSGG
jgi:nitrous oxidase accessory protein